MSERRRVETTYRGQKYAAEWYIEDGMIHVVGIHGSKTRPVLNQPTTIQAPSDLAAKLLWDLLRERDPKRPFFYWR